MATVMTQSYVDGHGGVKEFVDSPSGSRTSSREDATRVRIYYF